MSYIIMQEKYKKIAGIVISVSCPGGMGDGISKIVMMYYKHTKHVDNGLQ